MSTASSIDLGQRFEAPREPRGSTLVLIVLWFLLGYLLSRFRDFGTLAPWLMLSLAIGQRLIRPRTVIEILPTAIRYRVPTIFSFGATGRPPAAAPVDLLLGRCVLVPLELIEGVAWSGGDTVGLRSKAGDVISLSLSSLPKAQWLDANRAIVRAIEDRAGHLDEHVRSL